jgi:peroxiredoxin
MSKKRARREREAHRLPAPERPASVGRWRSPLRGGLAGVAVVAVAAAAFLAVRPSGSSPPEAALAGEAAPAFAERDVVTGEPVSSEAFRGRHVLLFFSEGVMCQACFEQIQALELRSGDLQRIGLTLVNVTTDPPSVLRQAAGAYRITTPLVSDEDRDMSRAYDVLGQGMHPDTAGHTFVVIDSKGRIRWRRDYTTMYVPPEELIAALPRLGSAG